jgi:hypothetical protein
MRTARFLLSVVFVSGGIFVTTDAFAQRGARAQRPAAQQQRAQVTQRNQVRPPARGQRTSLRMERGTAQPNGRGLAHPIQQGAVQGRLRQIATRFEREIRQAFTPVVHVMPLNGRARAVSDGYDGNVTEIQVTGLGADGVLSAYGSFGASGHVMNPRYGGLSLSQVEQFGQTDTIHMSLEQPGGRNRIKVLNERSQGLVSQIPFNIKFTAPNQPHVLRYWRVGQSGHSTGEGSERELREVRLIWDGN